MHVGNADPRTKRRTNRLAGDDGLGASDLCPGDVQIGPRAVDRDAWVLAYLLACYGQLGRLAEAQAQDAKFRARRPHLSLLQVAAVEPYESPADLDHLLDGLRKAGVSP